MQPVKVNEATAGRRIMVFPLVVDATDGLTPETGESGGQPQRSTDGGANWNNTNHTLTGGMNGSYQVQLDQAEVNLGPGTVTLGRYKSANTAEARAIPILSVPWDPYVNTDLGLTALPTAAPGGNGGLPTVDANNRIVGLQGTLNDFDALSGAEGQTLDDVGDLLDTLLGRLTAARAGYLDELAAANMPADLDAVLADTGTDGVAIADDSLTAAKFAAAFLTADKIAASALAAAKFAADTDTYQARVDVFDDDTNTTDRWVCSWFKNGARVSSGITVPKIQVVRCDNGNDLIAETAMTQVGTTGVYQTTEGTNRIVNGAAYIAIVSATIDGESRTWAVPKGRDSTA